MPQTISLSQLQEFLAQTEPFDRLSDESQQWFASKCQLLQYRMGQTILVQESMPTQVSIIYQGQVRMLGYGSAGAVPVSIGVMSTGEVLGWPSVVRNEPCETAIASGETITITIAAEDFKELLNREPELKRFFVDQPSLPEVFQLIVAELKRRADGTTDPKELASQIQPEAVVVNLPTGKTDVNQLDPNLVWLVSGGTIENLPMGSQIEISQGNLNVTDSSGARLLGFRDIDPHVEDSDPNENNGVSNGNGAVEAIAVTDRNQLTITAAPEKPPKVVTEEDQPLSLRQYPYARGRGPVDGFLACLDMISKYIGGTFKRDIIQRYLENYTQNTGNISLQVGGAVMEMIGIGAQLVQVPTIAINRVKAPALIQWQDSFALIYHISGNEMIMASPESGGVKRWKISQFMENCEDQLQILLLRPKSSFTKEKFGLHSFIPYVQQYAGVLTQVIIASAFVLMFSLANPLIVQIIIDKVLSQGSIDTLDVLGWLLIIVAAFEAILTGLRTYLFVDTTNRIDLSLGTQIIDHLLRLPLSYFDRRRVGELSTRINELENIRRFMTSTALTVVLDAVFSLVYIVIMMAYSLVLTFWALVTVPFFIVLALIASPIIRRQLRTKAERHADTQSYLVEVLSGMQTVKAQNIELKSRWQWQQRYARFVNAGFRTVLTSSWAGSVSNFLNKFSGLVLLWVGAHLVLDNQLTLGELIAFRIIASYVTSPLLRLAQLWQNFQEVGLSIERLSDIVDAEQEVAEDNHTNIPMPEIQGAVRFEEVSFRFNSTGPLQLSNINIDFPAGAFVGIVGQSGSGKSTLTKLIPRLYEPLTGRIQVDGYDIAKVELYSLRRQIGVVLQDTLLFNGTVQENIALTNPEATSDEIIEAARIAVAHDFIMELPAGYNTIIGERGAGLSGGQRQRIAIARTVLQRPRLLILDEATSALDYDSERQVCQNLTEAFYGETLFFITHRLNTIKQADTILMMDKGSIVEMGTHDELMEMRGRYYCLYQQQESQF
ncbi:cyclic nucleotide-regulated ABC bacteriocin/lantibiotic exporter [Thalassoporum mexicanum PCC 7367]|uniref:peptidase domain-containing ABC transporter n=1 Tax=Thalassoporum mexicanum TaxID=3457544 RepID=UPI00029FDBBE|nr:peptidase domain-containing ABC transporter [Pseudanabaena sp. PCC 7367]AFY71555.1 cyclic nucleotide-regulated ABC bacteriocin/lantibiotic exporter [Pseudanabaena sp. PCC 7367]